MLNKNNAEYQKIVDELAKLKPEASKMIMSDKVNNSAVSQELKDGDIEKAIHNHAEIMTKAYDEFANVPLIGSNYDFMLYVMLREAWSDIPAPYGSDNFVK
ncbi:hypothetical protein HMPREF9103_00831 [Lentilactobacillus parafarraginis F0439]|uniref:Uncharacterized protein n=3 Tax=Lentilactobacillus TaxID=2767893 RepID=H1LEY9_9LACO|nr:MULTISPECIES: hypothetical protein [Lentilactobacillus]EHL99848.1 hypothetical protein HMPREF9103_00831 [Lentilactobacillus parafarraginis F0439]EHO52228.1 hypothetical protein HMPREF9104_01165 [Lentilactobacillus kisonensis F0435]KRL21865.1 hypothetical protein FC98_GL000419 [Lentilactobacillus kisonensis DSM 19906 = JCM 15041]MDM7515189.1 hypothetical protein [Lentilactobacillus sp. TOM.63]OBU97829.1 hypothetical protein A7B51_00195 [Lentilactobacillus parabuchneri]